MEKMLVYVDGDNLASDEAEKIITSVCEENSASFKVCGKVYGNSEVIPSIIKIGYAHGFEFVDTSHLTEGKKNVTDMKLVVDCIADVVIQSDIGKVVILSKDWDFMPLIYKLKWLGVTVESPLYNSEEQVITIGSLNSKLIQIGFNPLADGIAAYDNQYKNLLELVGEEFGDRLILSFLTKKKRKFLSSISAFISKEDLAWLSDIPTTEFCFGDVLKVAEDNLIGLQKIYTLKMYGHSFKDKEAEYFLEQYKSKLNQG